METGYSDRELDLPWRSRGPVDDHDAVRVRVGDVRAAQADRHTAWLVEAPRPGRDTPLGAIEPPQRIVVGITDEHTSVPRDSDALWMLESRRVADAVDVAEVEQSGPDDRAHSAGRGEIHLADGVGLRIGDEQALTMSCDPHGLCERRFDVGAVEELLGAAARAV